MHCKSYSHFFSKKFQHICVSIDVNFNESLTNDVVSFEQLGPGLCPPFIHSVVSKYVQADLSLCCPHMPKDMFSHSAAHAVIRKKATSFYEFFLFGLKIFPCISLRIVFSRLASMIEIRGNSFPFYHRTVIM